MMLGIESRAYIGYINTLLMSNLPSPKGVFLYVGKSSFSDIYKSKIIKGKVDVLLYIKMKTSAWQTLHNKKSKEMTNGKNMGICSNKWQRRYYLP